jgi:shikimate dehydrogenase
MKGEFLPKQVLELASGLFDMAYGEAPTPAVKAAVSTALPLVDGVEFLLAQASLSFSLWTGMEAPLAEMRKAVENRSRP